MDEEYRNRSKNGRENSCWTSEERRMASQIRSERKVFLYIFRWVRFVDIRFLTILHYKHVWVLARFISRFSQRLSVMSRFFRFLKLSNSGHNVFRLFEKHGLQRQSFKKPWKCFGANENQPETGFSALALLRCKKHIKKESNWSLFLLFIYNNFCFLCCERFVSYQINK